MVLSELYMSGLIRAGNFNSSFSNITDEVYDKVISQCEKVYRQKLAKESKQVKNDYKNKIAALKNESKQKMLAAILHRLAASANSVSPEDTSKTYLQLSKIENYLSNSSQADNY